jgi:hypothetical protein
MLVKDNYQSTTAAACAPVALVHGVIMAPAAMKAHFAAK